MTPVRLYSALEILSIEEVEREKEALWERYFTPEERSEISGRRVQTTAGLLAAKRALVRLHEDLNGAGAAGERDFVLTHRESGAPRVVSAPTGPNTGRELRVSISHTRKFAYGLAVATEIVRG